MSLRERLIAWTWTERLTALSHQWAAVYWFGLVSSGRGDNAAEIGLAAPRPMGIQGLIPNV